MTPEIVPATEAHALAMVGRLRPADAAEIEAMGVTEEAALVGSVRASWQCWCALIDGEPAVIGGLSADSPFARVGVPWLLATPAVERHRRWFLALSRERLAASLAMFPRLENYVDARNGRAIRWLRWLGFTIEAPEPFGAAGMAFRHFWMEA